MVLQAMKRKAFPEIDPITLCRNFGKDLFMDRDTLGVGEAFGSFTDPSFTAAAGPLGHLSARVAYAWAGAVLHVLSAEDVEAFAKHVLGVLAPGGVWFGVG